MRFLAYLLQIWLVVGIQVLDINEFDSEKLDNAFSKDGVVLIRGWNASFVEDLIEAQKAAEVLFRSKVMSSVEIERRSGSAMRGYIPAGAESGLVDSVFEPKEGYSYGHPILGTAAAHDIELPVGGQMAQQLFDANVWPADVASATIGALERFYLLAAAVAERIAGTLGPTFGELAQRGSLNSLMRLFHYFPAAESSHKNLHVLGSSPHTDWGFLTVILQDGVGGLQVASRSEPNTWEDVPTVEGSLVIIAGDYLRAMSHGRYVSPVHRVVAPEQHHRTSFVYFHYPWHERPLPRNTVDRGASEGSGGAHNTLYDAVASAGEGVTFGDYMVRKWAGVKTGDEVTRTDDL